LNINTKKLHIKDLKKRFKEISPISLDDIVSFYRTFEESVKKTTVKWRVYALVDRGVIQRIGRGKYSLGKQKEFTPVISSENRTLYSILKEEYPFLDISIWTTQWVAQWMLHIPGTYETIIEVEKGSEESVFYFLSDIRNNVFLNPPKDILNKYAKTEKPIIIIKNLVTCSPLQEVDSVQIPSIEKILVDLIVDNELLSAYQGRDLTSIIENAFEYNTINMDTLLRYAGRRRKRTMVADLINDKR
tara:strand:- start:1374 stop:2108 length:735 start_codon:yes stop_codon:yes gene_type:complete